MWEKAHVVFFVDTGCDRDIFHVFAIEQKPKVAVIILVNACLQQFDVSGCV